MDRMQYDVLHSALIRMEKKQNEMAEDILDTIKQVKLLREEFEGKTLIKSDVDKSLSTLKQDIENLKDEVNA